MKRYWGLAQRITASALRGRAEIALSVFTLDEMDRLRAVGNRFLTDKYDGGVVLYDRAIDGTDPWRHDSGSGHALPERKIGRASCRESVSVRVDLGGRRIIKKKTKEHIRHHKKINKNKKP